MDVDLVYLWVDGSDPKWIKKRNEFVGIPYDNTEANNEGRYKNNDELKYSLRSVEKYVPWIRKIFIVTDNQVPEWLNTSHPKINIVDHSEIIPKEVLPTFNSFVIEYYLYRIPDISENFLYGNDDMLFNTNLTPDFFFQKNGFPIVRLKRKPLGKWHYKLKPLFGKELGQYRQKIISETLLIERKFGKYFSGEPHHNIDAYNKSDYRDSVERIFSGEVQHSLQYRYRHPNNLSRFAFSYYALAIQHAQKKYVSRKTSCTIDMDKPNYLKYINQYHPALICMNDNQRVSNADRTRARNFLEYLFSTSSSFEKQK